MITRHNTQKMIYYESAFGYCTEKCDIMPKRASFKLISSKIASKTIKT